MSVQDDKEISKSFLDDFEILSEEPKECDKSFKMILVGNKSN